MKAIGKIPRKNADLAESSYSLTMRILEYFQKDSSKLIKIESMLIPLSNITTTLKTCLHIKFLRLTMMKLIGF